jgi:hypothetical protein
VLFNEGEWLVWADVSFRVACQYWRPDPDSPGMCQVSLEGVIRSAPETCLSRPSENNPLPEQVVVGYENQPLYERPFVPDWDD